MAKRANGEGSIRKRNNGTWEGRYSFGDKRGSVYGKTKGEVKEKLNEITNEIQNNVFVVESKQTLANWLDVWQETYLEDVKKSSQDRYKSIIKNHIIPALGEIVLSSLKTVTIQKFLNDMKNKKILSEKSVKNIRLVLHKALDSAVENEMIRTNPCTKAKVPSYEEPPVEMRPLKDKEVSEFLKAIEGNPFERLYYVALFTGMRESEIIGLSWDCVDFGTSKIHLYRQLKRARGGDNTYSFSSLKNKQSRTFTAPLNVMAMLQKVKRQQSEWRLKAGTAWNNEDNLVFTNELGGHVHTKTVYRQFKRIVADIGLPQVRFHDLRHTYATLALQQGVDAKTVSSNLGHSTVAFTLDKYGHVSEVMQKNGAEKMQRLIESL